MNITLAQRNADLDHHNAAVLHRIELETSTNDTPITTLSRVTLGGDERRLRGIPAIGRGVAGHIPGTRP
jgi:hypothetical protein